MHALITLSDMRSMGLATMLRVGSPSWPSSSNAAAAAAAAMSSSSEPAAAASEQQG